MKLQATRLFMPQTNGGHLQGFLWVIFSESREFRLPEIHSTLSCFACG